MSNNYGCNYGDLWRIYKSNTHYQKQILEQVELDKLDDLSWKAQLEVLDNAPLADRKIKAHLHLLHPRAKKALGLEDERKVKKWSYKALS